MQELSQAKGAGGRHSWETGQGKQDMARKIRNILVLLLCSVVTGTLLLMLIFLLPVEPARQHVEESLYNMIEVREDPQGDATRKGIVSLKENFTDTLMVQNCLEKVEGKGLLEHAMYVYHYDIQGEDETTWLTEESLVRFLRQGPEGMHLREYSKYWHGYLIFLKPLLLLMSWDHLEIFLLVVQVLFLVAVVMVSCFRKKPYLGLGLLCAFLFMKPLRIWMSLAMSVCWWIILAAVLALLLFQEKLEERNWQGEFFLLVGIVTAYLDFLTYPIATLGIPFSIWLVQRQKMGQGGRTDGGKTDLQREKAGPARKGTQGLESESAPGEAMQPEDRPAQEKRTARKVGALAKECGSILWPCICWAVGYAGMWGMKWVTAELTCQTGTLRNAVWSIITRAEPLDGYQSFFSGVYRTWSAVMGQYDAAWYGILFGMVAAAAVVSGLICLCKARNRNWGITMGALTMAALLPVGWMILTQNHTAIHCLFTFRILGTSILALWCMSVSSIRTIWQARRTGGTEK